MALATELFSREAEQAVIGGLFVSPAELAGVAEIVAVSDLGNETHRKIYAAMLALAKAGDPVDIVTVAEHLEGSACLDDSDMAYMALLARDTPSAANVLSYAEVVRKYAQRRALLRLSGQLSDWAQRERDPEKILSDLRAAMDVIASNQPTRGLRALADIMPEVLDALDERANRTQALLGQQTGLQDLDRLLDGLCDGRLYVVAGRPSSGKSVLGLQLAREAVLRDQRVAFFSLEMPAAEVVHRLMASDIPLDLEKIQSARLEPHEWDSVTTCVERLTPKGLWVDDSGSLGIGDLVSRARRLHRSAPLGMVVVDYIGLLDGERSGDYSNRVQEISTITRALKQLAKELCCPVVALSQLNRTLEQRADKRPILSDLRESGSVEQDADVVLMVYRDELHNPDTPDKGCAELIVRKNRGGKIGTVPTVFRGEHCQFLPLAGALPSRNAPPEEPPKRNGFCRRGPQ